MYLLSLPNLYLWLTKRSVSVNISVLPRLARGHLVSDLIMINASLDIVLGEIDR